jgi:hypothetical protein
LQISFQKNRRPQLASSLTCESDSPTTFETDTQSAKFAFKSGWKMHRQLCSKRRYAAAASSEAEIHSLKDARQRRGTAFGTAWLVENNSSVDRTLFFPLNQSISSRGGGSSKRKLKLIHLLKGDSKPLCSTDVDDFCERPLCRQKRPLLPSQLLTDTVEKIDTTGVGRLVW